MSGRRRNEKTTGKEKDQPTLVLYKKRVGKKEDPVLGRNVTDLDKALEKCHGASTKNL